MAQNSINNLILAAMYQNDELRQSRILLDIAVEQIALQDSSQALERIEVLLDEYLSSYDCHFEELKFILKRLQEVFSTTNEDNKPVVN